MTNDSAHTTDGPLAGRVALVTGVSRDIGIGVAVATRLHELGAAVFATGWPPHDAEMPWGERDSGLSFPVFRHNLEDASTPAALVDEVVEAHGRIDILAAVHARSSSQGLSDLTVEELDRSWNANTRSVLLLAQQFGRHHTPAADGLPPTGRMIWFTSGQHLGPMENELPYVASKGALQQLTASLAAALSKHRIVANCINPGPVDTGYVTGPAHAEAAAMFPDGRWGTPDDVANLVAFLACDEGAWIRGQVLDSEGGFSRYRS